MDIRSRSKTEIQVWRVPGVVRAQTAILGCASGAGAACLSLWLLTRLEFWGLLVLLFPFSILLGFWMIWSVLWGACRFLDSLFQVFCPARIIVDRQALTIIEGKMIDTIPWTQLRSCDADNLSLSTLHSSNRRRELPRFSWRAHQEILDAIVAHANLYPHPDLPSIYIRAQHPSFPASTEDAANRPTLIRFEP